MTHKRKEGEKLHPDLYGSMIYKVKNEVLKNSENRQNYTFLRYRVSKDSDDGGCLMPILAVLLVFEILKGTIELFS